MVQLAKCNNMRKSEAEKLLSAIVKQYNLNTRHPWASCEMTRALKEYLLNNKQISRHVQAEDACFVIKYTQVAGRRLKMLHLVSENSGSLIILTKAKLHPEGHSRASRVVTRSLVLQAMRQAVDYQIKEFRSKEKAHRKRLAEEGSYDELRRLITCPISGKLMVGSGAKLHVDHYRKPFIQIADEYLESKKLDNYLGLAIKFRYGKPYLLEPESWQEWHKQEACLQLVNGKANIKKGAGGYKSKF